MRKKTPIAMNTEDSVRMKKFAEQIERVRELAKQKPEHWKEWLEILEKEYKIDQEKLEK